MDNNVIDQNMQPQPNGLQPIVTNDNNYQQPVVDNNQAVMPSQPLAPPPVEQIVQPTVEQVSNQPVATQPLMPPSEQLAPPPVMENVVAPVQVTPEVVMQAPVSAPVEQPALVGEPQPVMPVQEVMPQQVVNQVEQPVMQALAPAPVEQPVVATEPQQVMPQAPLVDTTAQQQPVMQDEQMQQAMVTEPVGQPVMPQAPLVDTTVQEQPVMQDVQMQMQQAMVTEPIGQPVMPQTPLVDTTVQQEPVMQDVQMQMQQAMVTEPIGQPVMPQTPLVDTTVQQEPVMQDVQMQMQQAMNPQIIPQMPTVQLMDTTVTPVNPPEQEYINNVPVYPGQEVQQAPVLIDTVEEEIPAPKKDKRKKNKKGGSTLAIIIGVILLVGVGFISLKFLNFDALDNFADTAKKSEFVNASLSYMNSAITKIKDSGLDTLKNDTLIIFIPVGNDQDKSCVMLDSGGTSPFDDNWKMAYVAAVYNSENDAYDYYFTGIDGANYGIKLSGEEKIKKEAEILVESDVEDYAVKLQEIYNSGESYSITPISDYQDSDLTEFSEMVGAEKAIILSKANCK